MATPPLNERWCDLDSWSTAEVSPSNQFNRWRDFVIDAHLQWDISRLACDAFPAFLRQGRLEGFRLIHLTSASGGVKGTRSPLEIARDDKDLFNLIYVMEGCVGLDFGSHQVRLDAGTFTLWDTTLPLKFDIVERLREVSLSVPKARLANALPDAHAFCGNALRATPGLSRLFVDSMVSLEANFGGLSPRDASGFLGATTDMMVAALLSKTTLPSDPNQQKQLAHAMAVVNRQVDNPHLTAQRLAQEAGMSERQLFRVFAAVNTTPAAWIRRRRLQGCREALLSQANKHLNIFEVAVRWGFLDPSNFSRSFKEEFGVTPRKARDAIAQDRK